MEAKKTYVTLSDSDVDDPFTSTLALPGSTSTSTSPATDDAVLAPDDTHESLHVVVISLCEGFVCMGAWTAYFVH